jgi:tripartite-type tricarboxylate transporter receptor subunit TctC
MAGEARAHRRSAGARRRIGRTRADHRPEAVRALEAAGGRREPRRAGGVIGTETVAKAAPDGYTLLLAYDGTHAVNASLYKSLPFDPVKDFAPVATLANVPFLLAVNASTGARDVKDFIERAKASPAKLTYGSAGNGSVNHLLGAMFGKAPACSSSTCRTRAQRRRSPTCSAAASTRCSRACRRWSANPGRTRARAGVTSAKRPAALPNVPTIAESGIAGFDVAPWFGLLAPAATPPDIIRQINEDVAALLQDEGGHRRVLRAGRRAVHDDACGIRHAAQERHRQVGGRRQESAPRWTDRPKRALSFLSSRRIPTAFDTKPSCPCRHRTTASNSTFAPSICAATAAPMECTRSRATSPTSKDLRCLRPAGMPRCRPGCRFHDMSVQARRRRVLVIADVFVAIDSGP